MQAAKIFGRFNVKVVRYDVGVGGEQEFDTNDYLAALSFMKSDFNRELLYRMYWPAGAKMTLAQVIESMYAAVIAEWRKREAEMLDATLAVALHADGADRFYARAHARRWPSLEAKSHGMASTDERYKRLCEAALTELFTSEPCKTCKGCGGWDDANGVHIECMDCLGFGQREWSAHKRAKAMKVDRDDFKEKGWDRAYTWATRGMLQAADLDYMEALGSEWA